MWILQLLIILYGIKIGVYLILSLRKRKRMIPQSDVMPTVDIILPMYNEEKVIIKTINNLLEISCNIIVVDDGSTDESLAVAMQHFSSHPRIKILQQANSGKSIALNKGVQASASDIVVCIDADTLVKPDAIDQILPYFLDERVAAVSGYVRVGNRTNAITNMQYIEYITLQNFERQVFESINGILVVPGALGAFRRAVVLEMGGFKTHTLAEDCDLTLRMLCQNYIIKNAATAVSFTEAPDNTTMFIKQRIRWTVGIVQGLVKHGKKLITNTNKGLTWIVLPYTWVFRIVVPAIAPVADYLLIGTCITGNFQLVPLYLLYTLLDVTIPAYILLKQQEKPVLLKWLALQRFLLRHLMFCAFIQIMGKNNNGWSKIPRTGNAKLE